MMPDRPTPAVLIGSSVIAGGLCASTYLAWRVGAYLALALTIPLSLLFLWGVADVLRQGVRRPTPFERFEDRLFTRFILIFVGGCAAVALLYHVGHGGAAMLLFVPVMVAALVSAKKLRGAHETSAGYKSRVGYRDSPRGHDGDADGR